MSQSVIHVAGFGKRYRIGERERYLALRDLIMRTIKSPLRLGRKNPAEFLWALKDVSLEIKQGEVVGLIGRNGAGKTTLLKLLARITRPTVGYAEVRGRVGSLLEVGTGFHPELTGRENVYLSGAILGMKKPEIERKFDEIVAFAGVERFIDTPLKHFSTGMMMRLAFAVAAHLEPEILLVDEVLAVGDFEFQKKCLGKMAEVSQSGRTIIFVSHQMNHVRRLCGRAVWIDGGTVRRDGPAREIVNEYEASCLNVQAADLERIPGPIAFARWAIDHTQSNQLDLDHCPDKIVVRFSALVRNEIQKGIIFIALRSGDNTILWSTMHHDLQFNPGPVDLVHVFEKLPLTPGIYIWEIRVFDGNIWSEHIQIPEMSVISKHDSNVFDHLRGCLNLEVMFEVQERVAYETKQS
jgi:ABC-type polysaccharide/polyol phosphate transport system ATPase subunit